MKRDHILGHKTTLNRLKSIKKTQSIFFDHRRIKLNIINRRLSEKYTDILKLRHESNKNEKWNI